MTTTRDKDQKPIVLVTTIPISTEDPVLTFPKRSIMDPQLKDRNPYP